jgi:uncharacterized membrane protein
MMHSLYIFCAWLHIMAAVVWVGGTIFLASVLLPAIRRPELASIALGLIRWTALRFRWVGWVCFVIFILTGMLNLAFRGLTWSDLIAGHFWRGSFGSALALKLTVVAIILAISALHDFVIGPRATAAWQRDAKSARTRRLRNQAVQIARLNLLLGLIAILLGSMLVRGVPW